MKIGKTTTTAATTATVAAITTTNSTTTSITINATTFEDSVTSASPSRYCEINFQKRIHIRFLNHQPVKIVVK